MPGGERSDHRAIEPVGPSRIGGAPVPFVLYDIQAEVQVGVPGGDGLHGQHHCFGPPRRAGDLAPLTRVCDDDPCAALLESIADFRFGKSREERYVHGP